MYTKLYNKEKTTTCPFYKLKPNLADTDTGNYSHSYLQLRKCVGLLEETEKAKPANSIELPPAGCGLKPDSWELTNTLSSHVVKVNRNIHNVTGFCVAQSLNVNWEVASKTCDKNSHCTVRAAVNKCNELLRLDTWFCCFCCSYKPEIHHWLFENQKILLLRQ